MSKSDAIREILIDMAEVANRLVDQRASEWSETDFDAINEMARSLSQRRRENAAAHQQAATRRA